MKKIFLLLVLTGIFLINPIVNAATNSTYISGVFLDVTFVSQDPYPAEPGQYVDLIFKLENGGNQEADNVIFEIVPQYPFSLNPGTDATKELPSTLSTGVSSANLISALFLAYSSALR